MLKRIVMILGAGASQPIVPVASDLLKVITSRSYGLSGDPSHELYWHPQCGGYIFRWLWEQAGKPNNFERLLDLALEKAHQSSAWPWESAAWLNAAHDATHAIALQIAKNVAESDNEAPIIAWLNSLNAFTGSITIGSLNWDDLVLKSSCPWYDGYEHKENGMFENDYFHHVGDHTRKLLWLHGSIHLNRVVDHSNGSLRQSEFQWNCNPIEELHKWLIGSNSDNRPVFDLPIVTGGDKSLQIFRRPFLEYWSVLYQDILQADTIAILGYSGHDSHLNSLLTEGIRGNSHLRKIVWVGKSASNKSEVLTTLARVLGLPQYRLEHECVGRHAFRCLRPISAQMENALPPRIETWVCLKGIETISSERTKQQWIRLMEIRDSFHEKVKKH